MGLQVERVPDAKVEQLAREGGPLSLAAQILRQLRAARTLDRQYFAFHVGNYWVTGPMLDAKAEAALIELAEEDEAQDWMPPQLLLPRGAPLVIKLADPSFHVTCRPPDATR